jgi:hypothetical protein
LLNGRILVKGSVEFIGSAVAFFGAADEIQSQMAHDQVQ